MPKQAILVVSFGTTHRDTGERNIGAIEQAVAATFPGWDIRRAFTSGMIRSKLRQRDGLAVDSVEEALERLAAEGYHRVLCQPTHVINGEEFDDIRAAAAGFGPAFGTLAIGTPLLTSTGDYERLAAILSRSLPALPHTAYCLMGHGSEHHPADAAYAALDYHMKNIGRPDCFVGTVEGFPDFDTMVRHLKSFAAKRCVLLPLMVVAGDHAVNDMAAQEEGSWRSRLEREGFAVECLLKGLGEYPEVRALYVAHLRSLMKGLGI